LIFVIENVKTVLLGCKRKTIRIHYNKSKDFFWWIINLMIYFIHLFKDIYFILIYYIILKKFDA